MKVLDLTRHAQARVWFGGGGPPVVPARSLSCDVDANPLASVAATHVTVEAFVPTGGFAQYALLGAAFETDPRERVTIEVPYDDILGPSWPASLAQRIDDVRAGMTGEFANPILAAMAQATARRFPPGNLRIIEAAHGAVGSSSNLFGRLAMCVVELMLRGSQQDEEEMRTLLRTGLMDQGSGHEPR